MTIKKLNPVHIFKLKELLFIILYWLISVRLVVLLNYFGIHQIETNFMEPKAIAILRENLIAATSAGFLIGLLTGLSELYFFQKYFHNKSFMKLILAKLVVYLISIALIAFFTLDSYYYFMKGQGFLASISDTLNMFTSNGFYQLLVMGAMLSLGINFILIVKNKIGSSIFIPILVGKYHRPKEENRIFLFIDLKSSTQAAEQLGHKKYSLLIQDCFRDLSDLVVKYEGSIYQFVGDEAVITWKAKKNNNYQNSIQLFFTYKNHLATRSDFYQDKYGTVPLFKAAVNSGEVMVAEVGGSIKSEIAYHGDVLNSTARMIELCNLYQKELILSEGIMQNIDSDSKNLNFDFQGELQLRGKDRKIKIYSATDNNSPKILLDDNN